MIGDRWGVSDAKVARTSRWLAPALSVGDLVMARRQLLMLKRLAELDQRDQRQTGATSRL